MNLTEKFLVSHLPDIVPFRSASAAVELVVGVLLRIFVLDFVSHFIVLDGAGGSDVGVRSRRARGGYRPRARGPPSANGTSSSPRCPSEIRHVTGAPSDPIIKVSRSLGGFAWSTGDRSCRFSDPSCVCLRAGAGVAGTPRAENGGRKTGLSDGSASSRDDSNRGCAFVCCTFRSGLAAISIDTGDVTSASPKCDIFPRSRLFAAPKSLSSRATRGEMR